MATAVRALPGAPDATLQPPRARSRMTPVKLRLTLVLLALLPLAGCLALESEPGVLLASDPPGARVIVDGADSGMVTPCRIDLPRDPQRVDLELPGYETATRYFSPDVEWDAVLWKEMSVSNDTWRNPLWLEWIRFIFPFWRTTSLAPQRVFVRMRISGEE